LGSGGALCIQGSEEAGHGAKENNKSE